MEKINRRDFLKMTSLAIAAPGLLKGKALIHAGLIKAETITLTFKIPGLSIYVYEDMLIFPRKNNQ